MHTAALVEARERADDIRREFRQLEHANFELSRFGIREFEPVIANQCVRRCHAHSPKGRDALADITDLRC